SSTGVGSLIKSYRAVLKKKGRLKLLSPSQSVRNILTISKLDGVFEIFSDESEALKSFAAQRQPKLYSGFLSFLGGGSFGLSLPLGLTTGGVGFFFLSSCFF